MGPPGISCSAPGDGSYADIKRAGPQHRFHRNIFISEIIAMSTETSTPKKRGRARVIELAKEAEAERLVAESKLVADLGHSPTAAEAILIEQASALTVRARRLRSLGHGAEADDVSRLLVRAVIALGLKAGKAKPFDIKEALAS